MRFKRRHRQATETTRGKLSTIVPHTFSVIQNVCLSACLPLSESRCQNQMMNRRVTGLQVILFVLALLEAPVSRQSREALSERQANYTTFSSKLSYLS